MITLNFKSNKIKGERVAVRVQAAMQSLIEVPHFLQSDAHAAVYVPVMKRGTISCQLDCVACFSTPEPSKSEDGEQKREVFSWFCVSSAL